MIEIDSQTPPARWQTGDGGRPRRPTISRRIDDGPEVVLMVELDCGHRFKVNADTLVDGWGEMAYSCPFDHVTVQEPGRPIREVALRVHQVEERLRRARRIISDVLGPRLFIEMERLLRENPGGCDEPDAKECAAPNDGESDPCWEHRRRELLDRLDRFL